MGQEPKLRPNIRRGPRGQAAAVPKRNEPIPKIEAPRRDRDHTPSPCPPQPSALGFQRFAAVAEKGGDRELPTPHLPSWCRYASRHAAVRRLRVCRLRGAPIAFRAGRLAAMGREPCSEMPVGPGPEPR
jgi:hypothetical protein